MLSVIHSFGRPEFLDGLFIDPPPAWRQGLYARIGKYQTELPPQRRRPRFPFMSSCARRRCSPSPVQASSFPRPQTPRFPLSPTTPSAKSHSQTLQNLLIFEKPCNFPYPFSLNAFPFFSILAQLFSGSFKIAESIAPQWIWRFSSTSFQAPETNP